MRTFLVTSLTVLLAALLLLGPDLTAAEGPLQGFAARMKVIRERVEVRRLNVVSAIAGGDWARWCNNHDAYLRELRDAERRIEDVTGQLLVETLTGGGTLDAPTIEAMDLAANQAANHARVRVIISAYGRLTRHGIPPHKRKDALSLLGRQGVYEPDAGAGGVLSTTSGRRCPQVVESPMTGRVAGGPEAAQHLKQWQNAVMKANAAAQRVASLRMELDTLPRDHEMRPVVEQRMAAAATQYDRLLKEAEDQRRLYYQAGGK